MAEQSDHPVVPPPEAKPPVAPMTSSLLARLWVVPALIVCVMLAVAVVVVLFGATSVADQQTVGELLDILDRGSGKRTVSFVMMPAEKDYWRAAQELARRFEHREQYLRADEIEPTADRLIDILNNRSEKSPDPESRLRETSYLLLALGRLGAPAGVPAIVARLRDEEPRVRYGAVEALAEMHDVPAAREAVSSLYPSLDDESAAVRLAACAAIASLAEPGDSDAIRAVSAKLAADRETQWNAAMTLARLGSPQANDALARMLDRSYWASIDLEYEEDQSMVRRKYTDAEISKNLTSVIDAAARLDDAKLNERIKQLRDDPSNDVREAALRVG